MNFSGTLLQVGGVLIFIQGIAIAALVASRWRRLGNVPLALLLGLLAFHGLGLLSWIGPSASRVRYGTTPSRGDEETGSAR